MELTSLTKDLAVFAKQIAISHGLASLPRAQPNLALDDPIRRVAALQRSQQPSVPGGLPALDPATMALLSQRLSLPHGSASQYPTSAQLSPEDILTLSAARGGGSGLSVASPALQADSFLSGLSSGQSLLGQQQQPVSASSRAQHYLQLLQEQAATRRLAQQLLGTSTGSTSQMDPTGRGGGASGAPGSGVGGFLPPR